MSAPIEKPYTTLPDYADVDYVDGKLRVAAGVAARTDDPDLRQRWLETADILLDQRNALASLTNPARAVCRDETTATAEEATNG